MTSTIEDKFFLHAAKEKLNTKWLSRISVIFLLLCFWLELHPLHCPCPFYCKASV